MSFKAWRYLVVSLIVLMSGCSGSDETAMQQPEDAAAIEANNRAVGLMGRFEYDEAQAVFAELAAEYPGWHDAKINLAIATLNTQQPGSETEAFDLAQQVLNNEPDYLRAHYVAGLVQLYLGRPAEAALHFRTVTDGDSQDAHAAYYLAQCLAQQSDYAQAIGWYERAMELDPYLRSAYYGAFQTLQRLKRTDEAVELAADYQRLENNPRSYLAEFKYTRMGPKGSAITVDLDEEPIQTRPEGVVFDKPAAISIRSSAPLKWRTQDSNRALSITAVDMQDDGLSDLFLAGAINVTPGDGEELAGNLIMHGQPDGDYVAQLDHPLASIAGVNAVLWGDYDNDGIVDVYLCRDGENQLWRQTAASHWENVSAPTRTAGANLNTVDGAFFDADHDGDLDLFLVNGNGPNELLNNNLDGTFRPLAADYGLAGSGSTSIMVLPADLDNDRDADLIVLNDNGPHEVYINDRLWSYRPSENMGQFVNSDARAVVAADINADGVTELYSIETNGKLLRWEAGTDGEFRSVTLGTPDVIQEVTYAHLASSDVDGDGSVDLIASSDKGWGAFAILDDALQPMQWELSQEPLLASVPFIGQSTSGPSILTLSESTEPLQISRPGPGRYPFITLSLSGRQDDAQSMRSNASGIGTHVGVRAGSRWSLLHSYRNDSAPGQGLQPLAVGLRGDRQADFVAIDWSDGVFQSEVNVDTDELTPISETQRQLSSCPVLFAWDGEQYAFVSDFLGVGGIGYAIGPGEYATPRPHENFLFPEGLLKAKDNRYVVKIGEPMEENAYIDATRLAIYDLPPGWQMVLDERMGISGPEPSGEAFFYRREVLPQHAVNDRSENVSEIILENDGIAAPVGALDRRFIGRLQSEHILTLSFAQSIDTDNGTPLLVIDGWVEYPYSQTNFAAWQAGAEYEVPTLEAFAGNEWHTVIEQFGYPAGMPRRMSFPLDELPSGTSKLRLRTNMQIYWDRISVAFAEDLPQRKKTLLPIISAKLGIPGFAKRTNLDQYRPNYDYEQLSPFWDTRYMSGFYTRLGEVSELVADADDAVAIIGPGEELHLEFDVVADAAEGWRRYFVLESNGWAKDKDLFTRDGDTVGPLPNTGKPAGPRDRLHERYNTRYQSGR